MKTLHGGKTHAATARPMRRWELKGAVTGRVNGCGFERVLAGRDGPKNEFSDLNL